MSSGPIIEELPDDYDASADRGAFSPASSSSAPAREVRPSSSTASSSSAGLRKGFFSKSSSSSAAVVPERSTASRTPSTKSVPAKDASRDVPVTSAPEAAPPISATQVEHSSEAHEAEISSLLDSLRTKLKDASSRAASRQSHSDEGEPAALLELRELLSSLTQAQNRWPTAQARNALTKASLEADSAMAEMRAASNDARRMRSGEEKKAITELRRATDDVVDRVRKVIDISAPKALSEEDKARAVTTAFHSLPFIVKLRVLADERSALALFLVAFAVGMILVFGMLAEVYTAWGCGYRCGTM